jgi:hypothetical protein
MRDGRRLSPNHAAAPPEAELRGPTGRRLADGARGLRLSWSRSRRRDDVPDARASLRRPSDRSESCGVWRSAERPPGRGAADAGRDGLVDVSNAPSAVPALGASKLQPPDRPPPRARGTSANSQGREHDLRKRSRSPPHLRERHPIRPLGNSAARDIMLAGDYKPLINYDMLGRDAAERLSNLHRQHRNRSGHRRPEVSGRALNKGGLYETVRTRF